MLLIRSENPRRRQAENPLISLSEFAGPALEIKRRTQKVRVFPDESSLTRLVSAVLVEIDDQWAADAKAYIKWECQDA
jgi:transposase-like protein